ncbi:coiled-coil domain-containing protein [Marinigracilibium pacificum]|uniref:Uncharacterized protein n=1 Tax=Marinigracilibium pacificum TaxID=2729599 RepID=A0A848IT94_9BACT|nr:hypothetical protein [Marinigracilibium pacificum]NMM46996.1 hypothetical protein [Marinigracilibium pacificum]
MIYLIVSSLEYFVYFPGSVRLILFIILTFTFLGFIFGGIIIPLIRLIQSDKLLSDEQAAIFIGEHFPEISDRLINTLQLKSLTATDHTLIRAEITKRTEDLQTYNFSSAVNFTNARKYLKYVIPPLGVIILVLLVYPSFITNSTERLINFNKHYSKPAPFDFEILTDNLIYKRGDKVEISVQLSGNKIPANCFLVTPTRKYSLGTNKNNVFSLTIEQIQKGFEFYFEAAGFNSQTYELLVVDKAMITSLNINANYPPYTGLKNESFKNTNNIIVPEGTELQFEWQLQYSDQAVIIDDTLETVKNTDQNISQITYFKTAILPQNLSLSLIGQDGVKEMASNIELSVIKDEYPAIEYQTQLDSVLFSYFIIGGKLSDDYGISRLRLYYRNNPEEDFNSILIPVSNQPNTGFYYQWNIDSLINQSDYGIEYFLSVWDNDAVNGNKRSNTSKQKITFPSRKEIREELSQKKAETESGIEKQINKAEELNNQLEDLTKKLKTKKELDYNDKQEIKDILKKQEELRRELQQMKETYNELNEQQKRFTEVDEELKNKSEQLQKLMDEILDEETKKLYDELQKMLEEQSNLNEIQEKLDDIQFNEKELEENLDRALKLFKQLQFDLKLNESINQLEDIQQKQEELSNTEDENELEQQKEIQENFEELKNSLDELNDINKDLTNPHNMENTGTEQENIEESIQKSIENLEQNSNPSKTNEQQKKTNEQMKQMQQSLAGMQKNMEMESISENLDNLRFLLENLIKISIDQEDLFQSLSKLDNSDPRYNSLAKKQLEIKDDSKLIEDSLRSLASRVFVIEATVTRELASMNKEIDKSVELLKEKKVREAVADQQFAMMHMNNLALLLDDVMQQMQQAMANAMGMPNSQKGKQPGMPGLKQLQQQLSNKIEELKKSGKTGRQLSEELARYAAEQERIRRMMEELKEELDNENGGSGIGGDLLKKMEENEEDLVNKRLTEKTIERQKEIMTRMLEFEKAMKERELDEERKGETAQQDYEQIPPSFKKYIEEMEKEIELLKTVPLNLNPYYKNEVNKYINKIQKTTN